MLLLTGNGQAMSQDNNTGPIIATIKPLYSLLSQLTEGVEQPVLLIKQPPSGHHFSLRPSERRLLADARMIVWVGPELETSLAKIIQQRKNASDKPATVISVMQAPRLKRLNKRDKDSHQHEHQIDEHQVDKHQPDEHRETEQQDDEHRMSDNTLDPHIWLSTHNASVISLYLSEKLIADRPQHTALYKNNLQRLLKKIQNTQHLIQRRLKPHNDTLDSPYLSYHDAFQYFEVEHALNYSGTINFSDESGPSMKHIQQIRSRIQTENIHCLIYQPPRPAIIDSLVKQTFIKATELDPLGLNIHDNKNAWFELMRQLADGFAQCLNP